MDSPDAIDLSASTISVDNFINDFDTSGSTSEEEIIDLPELLPPEREMRSTQCQTKAKTKVKRIQVNIKPGAKPRKPRKKAEPKSAPSEPNTSELENQLGNEIMNQPLLSELSFSNSSGNNIHSSSVNSIDSAHVSNSTQENQPKNIVLNFPGNVIGQDPFHITIPFNSNNNDINISLDFLKLNQVKTPTRDVMNNPEPSTSRDHSLTSQIPTLKLRPEENTQDWGSLHCCYHCTCFNKCNCDNCQLDADDDDDCTCGHCH